MKDNTTDTQDQLNDLELYEILEMKGFSPEKAKEHAKFMVMACNSHRRLVEALKTAFPYVQQTYWNLTTLTKNPVEDDLNKIKAALYLVENQS